LPFERNFHCVVRSGVQVRGHLVGIQVADGFHRFAFGKIAAAAAVWTHAGEEIRRDRNVARGGNLVRQVLHPVGHAEDFVDDQDDGRFVL